MLVQLGYQMLLVTPDMAIGDILQKAPRYQWNKAIKPTQSAVWVSEQGYLQNGGRHRIATVVATVSPPILPTIFPPSIVMTNHLEAVTMPGLEHPKVTQLRYALVLLLCCVASGIASATCNSNIVRTAPDNRYQIQAGGAEVLDTQTNLIWQRCSLGQTFNNLGTTETSDDRCDNIATVYTWQGALQAAQGIATNSGQAWFLPNINELASLVELACFIPAINETVFPDTLFSSSTYWSSSPLASPSFSAWGFRFDFGGVDFLGKSSNRFVRVVRASQ